MRKILWRAVTAALLASPQAAMAFDVNGVFVFSNQQLGDRCQVTRLLSPKGLLPGGDAAITLVHGNGISEWAGGNQMAAGVPGIDLAPVSLANIATCFDQGVIASSLTQNGATTTFAAQSSMSLMFNVTFENGDVTTYSYQLPGGEIAPVTVLAGDVGPSVEETQAASSSFTQSRTANLANNQASLGGLLMGGMTTRLEASATENFGFLAGEYSEGNAWGALESAWSSDSSYTLGTMGAHSKINPDLLIGAMLQFDYSDDDANNISGTGWMVGPYFVAKLPDQPLYLEGRLLYGQTDNDITPVGQATDTFETERFLVQMRTTGEYRYQATTLMPLFDVTYSDDTSRTYTNSLGNVISGAKTSLLQAAIGMDFRTPIAVQTGSLDLTGGLSAIHAATSASGATSEDTRGRMKLGLAYGLENGSNLRVGTFYDGIGSDYESRGVNLSFDMKF